MKHYVRIYYKYSSTAAYHHPSYLHNSKQTQQHKTKEKIIKNFELFSQTKFTFTRKKKINRKNPLNHTSKTHNLNLLLLYCFRVMATNSRDGEMTEMDSQQKNNKNINHQYQAKTRPSGLEILAEAAMFSQKQDTENNNNMTQEINEINNTDNEQATTTQLEPQVGNNTLDVIQNFVKNGKTSNNSVSLADLLNELNMTPEVFEYVLKEIQKREDEKRKLEEQKRAEIYKQLASLKNNNSVQKPTTLVVPQQTPIILQPPVINNNNNQALAQLQAQQQLLLQLQQINTTSPTVANFQARQTNNNNIATTLSTNSLGTNSNSSLSPMTGPNTANSTPQNQFIPNFQLTPTSLQHQFSSMDVVKEEENENEKSIDDQVDEHFMKALGEKWKTLKQQTIGKFRKNHLPHPKSINKPRRSTSFTTQTAPQRPTSLMNNNNLNLLVPRKTTGGGSMKISKTGPACVNYTTSNNKNNNNNPTTIVGSTTPTYSTINHHQNQPVLSHLISVPYIIQKG